jgi:hypothetical protein
MTPLRHASIRPDILAIHPACLGPGQEAHNTRNLLGSTNSIHRVESGNHLHDGLGLSVIEEVCARGAGGDGIDSDSALAKVLCEHAGHLLDCALGGVVEEVVWRDGCGHREGCGEEDDAAAIGDVRYCGLEEIVSIISKKNQTKPNPQ